MGFQNTRIMGILPLSRLKFEFSCFFRMIFMGKMTIKKVVEENLLSSLNPDKVFLTKNEP
jgi:hypothetical protein